MVIQWNLSDRKSPQVSRTIRSILADLNNAVVLMVSTHYVVLMVSTHYVCHFLGQVLGCAYTICLYGQI